jgi:hypothetical protein
MTKDRQLARTLRIQVQESQFDDLLGHVTGVKVGSCPKKSFKEVTSDQDVYPDYSYFTKDELKQRIKVIKARGSKRDQYEIPRIQHVIAHLDEDATIVGTVAKDDIEKAAEKVHDKWMANQKASGHTSHKSPDGKEEYMVPYDKLSEPSKKLDRDAAKAVLSALKEAKNLKEDGAASSVGGGGIAGIGVNQSGQPSTDKFAQPGVQPRKKLEAEGTFAGADVFKVNMDKIMSARFAPKNPRHRYAKYIGTDEDAEDIRAHARGTRRDVILQDKATGVMQYLRQRKK